ncbi:type 4 prepilin peptidase 1 . Aspartic peptidase. MEROPS family A24A [Pseudidiomarina indica]|uniref:Prepilin leader peptidase/N-methyltransferase n=1 Tax=Pseudidiomarina indica TaxID=1159017 RepID=A0A1G6BCH5_9GAMM|nr:A24 family peptidase [Pseudidiomarina indica]SDB18318.1 type 4 prepilin peptidase 1 . Aspartic peptidase. MEROPS family A24A [Pseudidiomarina indica]
MDWIISLPTHNLWVATTGLVLGVIIGSFLNVVIARLPVMLQRQWAHECAALQGSTGIQESARFNLAVPRSQCPQCHTLIAWYDNIPVLSWLMLKAKCRHCHTPIAARYPLIELATGIIFAIIAWYFGVSLTSLVYAWLACLLIALFFIDLDHMLLPDQLTYLVLWSGLAWAWYGGSIPLADAVLGAMLGYLSLWAVFWAFKLLTGKDGMGYGDFKLLAAFGAWHGAQLLPVTVIAAAVTGAVIGMIWQRVQQRQGQPIPFGPFLILGGTIALLWGHPLLSMYLNWVMR